MNTSQPGVLGAQRTSQYLVWPPPAWSHRSHTSPSHGVDSGLSECRSISFWWLFGVAACWQRKVHAVAYADLKHPKFVSRVTCLLSMLTMQELESYPDSTWSSWVYATHPRNAPVFFIHNRHLPLPQPHWATRSTTPTSKKRSPTRSNTSCWPCALNSVNRDSSVKRTPFQCAPCHRNVSICP